MRTSASLALAVCLSAWSGAVDCSSLKVVPVRVHLDSPSSTAVVTLTNNGPDRVTVQIDAKDWDQDEQGQDRYSETRDIVFFPRILDVEPAAERIIRIGYQGSPAPESEGTYRLFLQELPLAEAGEQALRFVLTLSIPIFVKPGEEHGGFAIEQVEQERGMLRIRAGNAGNTHVLLNAIKVLGLDSKGQQVFSGEKRGWYLLPEKSGTYELPIPETGCSQAEMIQVELRTADRTATTLVDAGRGLCGSPNERRAESGDTRGQDME